MMARSLLIVLILISFSSCKNEELNLPENTVNGILTIEGIDYTVNYGMIRNFGPDSNDLHDYWLVLSDYPIGWDQHGQFFSSSEKTFSIIISFKNFDNTLIANEYKFWQPENNPEPYWWVINHLSTKSESLNHPGSGKIVLSELDGNYSVLLNLNDNNDENLVEIKGTVYGSFKIFVD